MHSIIQFLVRHGYLVLFAWVFIEQLALPVPSIPILLASGALAGSGRMSLAAALMVAVLAALLGDSFWFAFGRTRGTAEWRQIAARREIHSGVWHRRNADGRNLTNGTPPVPFLRWIRKSAVG